MSSKNRFRLHRPLMALTLALALPISVTPARAQASGNDGNEIIVTAQKRATVADRTPISLTAVTGADIAARGAAGFTDIAAGTPGVSLKSNGPGQTEFEMRGVTSSGGNSPTVGFYLDDIPLTSPASAQNGKVVIDPTLYDLAQVEVLRGPQGTLYGASSMGGTVKLVTNKPRLDTWDASGEIIASGTRGGGLNNSENAMINVPLGHTLALRAVISQGDTSGWVDRVVVGSFPAATNGGITRGAMLAAPVLNDVKNANAEGRIAARVALLWQPAPNLSITPAFMVQHTHQDGPSAFDSDPGTTAHYQPFNIAEPYNDNIKIGSVSIDWRLPGVELTSATSYWSRSSSMTQDNSENLPGCPGGFCVTTDSASFYGPDGTGPIHVTEVDPTRQFSQEVRAASAGNGRLKWLVGAYFADFHSNWNLYENAPNPSAFDSPTSQIFTVHQPTRITQEALFGEATWSPTQSLHLTAGLRGYHYETTIDTSTAGYGMPSGTDAVVSQPAVQKNSGVNPKFTIAWDANRDVMLYATAARGFRPGGGNLPLPSSPDPNSGFRYAMYNALLTLGYPSGKAPVSYGPDHLWSYEIGEKAKFLNGHLHLNTGFYYENWKNIQLEQLPLDYVMYNNVNTAHIYGAEAELRAVQGEWSLGAAVGYTHATLALTQYGFVAGQRLPDVPTWSGSSDITWTHRLDNTRQLTVRLDQTFVGRRVTLASDATNPACFNTGPTDCPSTPLPSYLLLNLRAGVKSTAGWTIAAFVDNLTDKRAWLEYLAQLGFPNAAYNRVVTNQPRTIGLDFSIHL